MKKRNRITESYAQIDSSCGHLSTSHTAEQTNETSRVNGVVYPPAELAALKLLQLSAQSYLEFHRYQGLDDNRISVLADLLQNTCKEAIADNERAERYFLEQALKRL